MDTAQTGKQPATTPSLVRASRASCFGAFTVLLIVDLLTADAARLLHGTAYDLPQATAVLVWLGDSPARLISLGLCDLAIFAGVWFAARRHPVAALVISIGVIAVAVTVLPLALYWPVFESVSLIQ